MSRHYVYDYKSAPQNLLPRTYGVEIACDAGLILRTLLSSWNVSFGSH